MAEGKISESQLSENKKLFQDFIDASPNGIFIKKMDGEYILVNKKYKSLLQTTDNEIIGKTDHDLLPQDLADAKRNSDYDVAKARSELQTEETIEQKDGIHTYIVVKFPLFNKAARIYAIGGISTEINERKKLENSLIAGNKFFEMSLDIVLIASMDKFIKVNPAMVHTLGYSEEELLSGTFFTYMLPEDHEITSLEVDKLKSGVTTIQFENRWMAKDGSVKWISWSVSPDVPNGLLYAVGRNVTSQKEIENSLEIVNNFFEIAFDPFFVTQDMKIIKINPAFTKILGYFQNDLEKISLLDIIHPDYTEITKERFNNPVKEEIGLPNLIIPMLSKTGSYIWVEARLSPDGGTGMTFTVLHDISKRKMNEEKLNIINQKLIDDEQQIKSIFDNAPDPVIVIDSESKIIKWNPRSEFLFGWLEVEVIGKPLYEFIIPKRFVELHKKGIENFLMTGVGPIINHTLEIEAVNKKGFEFPIALSVSPFKTEGKDFFIGFVRDITETKKAIDDLQKNEEKLTLILENIGEGVIVANSDKKVIMVNDMVSKLYENGADEKITPNLASHFELYFPDGKTVFPSQNLPMERALKGEATDDVELVLLHSITKKKRRVLISGRPLMDENNKIVVAVVTIKDISKYKELEEELKTTALKYKQSIGFKKNG
ncbi:PAS domain-containing protein [Flavobacterium sp.]|uniref:PAS domain-containing protein n=1 Tax=Flavobacterium sp. TaxID=239 RepID=UPI003752E065